MSEGQDSARARLSAGLRALRESADGGLPVTFRELAARTHFGAATLNKAATGKEVPTWPVVEGFVRGCGGDPEGYRELWEQAKTETTAEAASPVATPLPETAAVPGEAGAAASASVEDPAAEPAALQRARVPGWAGWIAAAVALVAVVALAAVLMTSRGQTAAPAMTVAPTSTSPAASGAPAASAAPGTAAAPASTAQISSPPGPTVGFAFNVAGTVSGPPAPGRALWEVTLENDDSRFYPLNRACVLLGDQQFSCGATYAGQEVMAPGQYQYTVLVLDADQDAVAAFRQYNQLKKTPAGASVHGMPALPTGSRIIGQKTVTRS